LTGDGGGQSQDRRRKKEKKRVNLQRFISLRGFMLVRAGEEKGGGEKFSLPIA